MSRNKKKKKKKAQAGAGLAGTAVNLARTVVYTGIVGSETHYTQIQLLNSIVCLKIVFSAINYTPVCLRPTIQHFCKKKKKLIKNPKSLLAVQFPGCFPASAFATLATVWFTNAIKVST